MNTEETLRAELRKARTQEAVMQQAYGAKIDTLKSSLKKLIAIVERDSMTTSSHHLDGRNTGAQQ